MAISDRMMTDGGSEGIATPTPTLTPAQQQVAVRKLNSGQPLTDAERNFLGMNTPTPTATPTPIPVDDGSANALKAAEAAAAKAEADRIAAIAAAKAESDRLAAEQAIRDAQNAAQLAAAQAALTAANAAAAAAAAAAANANSNLSFKSLQDQIAALTKQLSTNSTTAADTAAAALAASKTTARKNMIDVLYSRFKTYGLETLAKKIEQLAIDGATEDTITIQLQGSEEYQTRFKANTVRVKNDLKYLSPAEYLNLEDSYRQVLRAYGLKAFDNDAYVSQFIANDMSPTELSTRVVTAVQRVRNADPAVSKQLRDYYGIGQEDLVAYVLDPQQQFQKIERQVAASEIGVAAGRQGLTAGVTVAEQLAAQGVTQAEAQKGYATIADILPGAEKLSNIYGSTMDVYGQAEGEQEVFNSLASAQRKRQKLSATEAATFGATAGTNRVSLTSAKSPGQF
jgi:hypothetical protein